MTQNPILKIIMIIMSYLIKNLEIINTQVYSSTREFSIQNK